MPTFAESSVPVDNPATSLLRVAPPTPPFPAQYLHRRPSLWLRTSITTSLWTSLTRSHHSKAGGLNRSVTEALP